MLGIFPELLLSLGVLILVVYGLRGSILKVSIVMLILVIFISLCWREEFMFVVNYGANGLLFSSG